MTTIEPNVVPLVPPTLHISVKRIKKNWWTGRVGRATFFAPTLGEIVFKACRYRRASYVASLRPNRIADKIITRIHDESLAAH